jgi:phosphatidylserine synthase
MSVKTFNLIVVRLPGVLVLLGLLMVSRVPYPHAVQAIVRGRNSMPFLAALVFVFVLMAIDWQLALAACTIGYVIWGVLLGTWRFVLRRRDEDDEDDEDEPAVRSPSRN